MTFRAELVKTPAAGVGMAANGRQELLFEYAERLTAHIAHYLEVPS